MPNNPAYDDTVYSFSCNASIKRDGTLFESRDYVDGVWCRFQRNNPKKIGGYKSLYKVSNSIPRGLITMSIDGQNYIFTGNSTGLSISARSTYSSEGSGPFDGVIAPTYGVQTVVSRTSDTSFTVKGNLVNQFKVGSLVSFTNTGLSTYTVVSSTSSGSAPNIITSISLSSTIPATISVVYSVSATPFGVNPNRLWQFDVLNDPEGDDLAIIALPGVNLTNIDSSTAVPILYSSVLPSNNTWTFSMIADTAGQNPTGNLVRVDGGVVCLYPFIFAYGSNGLIINNHVDELPSLRSLNDWNGPTAGIVNVAAGKIVKGLPVRGGTASPSGVFWALDSLIRVSFNASGPRYWQYDLIANGISIMSSNAVVQADGIYYWMGVDRFYVYNGNVSILPNDKNSNYLFDNITYSQRNKVWATTVPRYSEIWWFYPRDGATECNDAIIYNTQSKSWYDAGKAVGARRSCGFQTEVFPYPIWAGNDLEADYVSRVVCSATPSGSPAPTTATFYVAGDASLIFTPGNYASISTDPAAILSSVVSSVLIQSSTQLNTYVTLQAPISAIPLVEGVTVYAASSSGYSVWQHETGFDKVDGSNVSPIYSSFETNEFGFTGGGPSEEAAVGLNRNTRVFRLEPDFVRKGPMRVALAGRAYASSDEVIGESRALNDSTPYVDFNGSEFRQVRFKFESETVGGHYELGRLLLTLDKGDKQPSPKVVNA